MLIYQSLYYVQLIVFQGEVAFKTSLTFVLFQLNRLGSVYEQSEVDRASYAVAHYLYRYRYEKQLVDLR